MRREDYLHGITCRLRKAVTTVAVMNMHQEDERDVQAEEETTVFSVDKGKVEADVVGEGAKFTVPAFGFGSSDRNTGSR